MVAKVGSPRAAQVGERYGAGCASNGEVAAVADSAGGSNGTIPQQGQVYTTADGRCTCVAIVSGEHEGSPLAIGRNREIGGARNGACEGGNLAVLLERIHGRSRRRCQGPIVGKGASGINADRAAREGGAPGIGDRGGHAAVEHLGKG